MNYIYHRTTLFWSRRFQKQGMCWVFVLTALLLKQISMIVMLDTRFQHVLGIFVRCWIWCSNILAQFSMPCFMSCCTRALSY